MTAYDVVFSKEYSTRYMQKDAGIGSILKNTRRGIQRAAQQRSIANEYKKMKKFDARQVDYANRANAMRAASDDTLNNAAAQSGWRNLWGNIKGSNQAGKADDLMVRSNDAMKASVRRQMAIEKQLVAQGATPEQARAIMRNNNAQKYLQYGDARGAINLQATRDRRMQAVTDGRARQQAAQAAAQPAAQPAAQATQQAAQVSQPAVQAAQPAVQTANNALNGGGGFSATFGNASDTMSGNANTVPQHINLNKNFGKAAPRKQTAGTGTTRQGQMTAQQASQAAVQPAAQAAQPATQAAAKAAQPAVQAAHASAQPAAQAANNALNGGGFSATFNNATTTMSGNTGAMPQAINRNKKRRRAARRKKTGGPVATQQGQMPAQPAAPTPVNNQPAASTNAAPQPTAQAGAANSPVATAPQPTAQAATAPTGQGMSLLEKAQLAGSAANLVMPLMLWQMMGQQPQTAS